MDMYIPQPVILVEDMFYKLANKSRLLGEEEQSGKEIFLINKMIGTGGCYLSI